jgi:hypothetical protein
MIDCSSLEFGCLEIAISWGASDANDITLRYLMAHVGEKKRKIHAYKHLGDTKRIKKLNG